MLYITFHWGGGNQALYHMIPGSKSLSCHFVIKFCIEKEFFNRCVRRAVQEPRYKRLLWKVPSKLCSTWIELILWFSVRWTLVECFLLFFFCLFWIPHPSRNRCWNGPGSLWHVMLSVRFFRATVQGANSDGRKTYVHTSRVSKTWEVYRGIDTLHDCITCWFPKQSKEEIDFFVAAVNNGGNLTNIWTFSDGRVLSVSSARKKNGRNILRF